MIKIYKSDFFLTPAECNAQGRMPITLLINRLIEVATLHANELGIGYATLVKNRQTWVLSRVAVEMKVYPVVNDHYSISTWIPDMSRLFCERNFEICDGAGNTIGYARTVWAVLDIDTRKVADVSEHLAPLREAIPEGKECPIAKPAPLRALRECRSEKYRFTYCDIDFNRHVNSSRYIELLLNQWSLDFHDHYRLSRFEIAYMREAYFGEEMDVRLTESGNLEELMQTGAPLETRAELIFDGTPLCRSLLRFTQR